MITSLAIENLSIIRQAQINIEGGLSVVTGETGAGKSVLVNAIGLFLNWRDKPITLRKGAKQAEITLGVDLKHAPVARQWLQTHYPQLNHQMKTDKQQITMRLTFSERGRKKAQLNDTTVPATTLSHFAALLFDICGQNSHQSLLHPKRHSDILDRQCGHQSDVKELADLAECWRATQTQLNQVRQQTNDVASKRALLEYQIAELDELSPQENEVEKLEEEHSALSQREHLLKTCHETVAFIDDDDSGAQTALARHVRELEPFDISQLQNVSQQLHEALIVLQSAAADLREFARDVDLSDERLNEVETRLSRYADLARKHNTQRQNLFEHSQGLRDEMTRLKNAKQDLAELEKTSAQQYAQWETLAKRVSEKRKTTAKRLERDVADALAQLAMPDAVFKVLFEPTADYDHDHDEQTSRPPPHPLGYEHAYFHIRVNPGSDLALLSAVASGGETSRVSLALNASMAKHHPVPTLIFDEIEVGVGGATAETIGAMLKRMSRKSQILCVTHLPQIAAQAQRHYFIEKHSTSKQTDIRLNALTRPDRDREIARMIAGTITERALAHAEELLDRHA